MTSKKKETKRGTPKTKAEISGSKKRIFWIITFSLPVIFFLLLEAGLRIFNYGGSLDLFEEGPAGYENYLRCNPNVARRFFASQSGIPTPPKQLFLKVKPSNGYRIFVLGESSAAGFPYGNNVSFPNILERALSNTFPDKKIEVVNVSMAAINSYSLLDFMDEILRQAPDAILIYTGHNEYYGALGVGSEQSIGNSRWLIRTYLKLNSVRTFLLLRDFLGWIRIQFNKIFSDENKLDPSATLMERIVAKQTIPYGSQLYEAGKDQFKENMDEILKKATSKKVPLILSELVSNIKDQKPFISVKDYKGNSADMEYAAGKKFESENEFDKAKIEYIKAKDLDALRFRAPEEFNSIIRGLGKKYNCPVVPAVNVFEKVSPNGLIGNNLMLEHLHPNKEGYFLLAKAFYETMKENNYISKVWDKDLIDQEKEKGITGLDSVYAAIAVQQLKAGWPFKSRSVPNSFLKDYKPSNQVEQFAFQVLNGSFSLEAAHMALGEFYENKGEYQNAFSEYNALITAIPTELEFYKKAALVLLREKNYSKVSETLMKSLNYKENYFAFKWIGQIALMDSSYNKAIQYLNKADMGDPQVVFNLSRAYYLNHQKEKGDEFYLRLQNLAPKSEYIPYLSRLRVLMEMKKGD